MNDEYFLNQWFLRSLERSRQPVFETYANFIYEFRKKMMSAIDRSVFLKNLLSSGCWIMPYSTSSSLSGFKDFVAHFYRLLPFQSSHSLSFWLFLSYECKLVIQVANRNVDDRVVVLHGNENYYFDNGKCVSIADRWIHIVLTKIDSQSNYQIWIDGQNLTKFNRYDGFINGTKFLHTLEFLDKFDNTSLIPYSNACIADVQAFKRCLTPHEIQAIHQQQTSIKQVKVGTYINSNKIHNIEVD
jgi:hypothetical protein